MRQLGANVSPAMKKLAMGDDEYAAGQYMDAYHDYSQAYRAATKSSFHLRETDNNDAHSDY